MPVKLHCVGGARPNFMKLAPLCRALADGPFEVRLVHTGQHYDDTMSEQFFRDLSLPAPSFRLQAGSGTHAQQTAEIMRRYEPVLIEDQPAGVVVVGDVNSTIACALTAKKLGLPVIHVEAGLRSFDRSMPEEINRLATDAISDLFLVTEQSGMRNLAREGVSPDRMELVGNLMVDSLRAHIDRATRTGIQERLGAPERYGLITLHRPANVDSGEQLADIMNTLATVSADMPLYFPVHPRTRGRIEPYLTTGAAIHFIEPLGYIEFLGMMSAATVVLTDSGGIQEETTALGVPCLTLRKNTERPATVEEGTNMLAGVTRASILEAWAQFLKEPKRGRIPLHWDGNAALRCRQAIERFYSL